MAALCVFVRKKTAYRPFRPVQSAYGSAARRRNPRQDKVARPQSRAIAPRWTQATPSGSGRSGPDRPERAGHHNIREETHRSGHTISDQFWNHDTCVQDSNDPDCSGPMSL